MKYIALQEADINSSDIMNNSTVSETSIDMQHEAQGSATCPACAAPSAETAEHAHGEGSGKKHGHGRKDQTEGHSCGDHDAHGEGGGMKHGHGHGRKEQAEGHSCGGQDEHGEGNGKKRDHCYGRKEQAAGGWQGMEARPLLRPQGAGRGRLAGHGPGPVLRSLPRPRRPSGRVAG